jgi:hypothetical protein
VAVTAWKICGTGANDSSTGAVAWSNPTNIQANNNTRATSALSVSNTTTQILRATNFGFTTSDIPSGSTIDGIEVGIDRQKGSGGTNNATDLLVRLRTSSGQTGSDKATATAWPNGDAVATYGGATDTWSAGLSDSDILSSGFGVDIQAQRTGGSPTAAVDYVEVRVHYTEPSSPNEGWATLSAIAGMEAVGEAPSTAPSEGHATLSAVAGMQAVGEAPSETDPGTAGSHPATRAEAYPETYGRGDERLYGSYVNTRYQAYPEAYGFNGPLGGIIGEGWGTLSAIAGMTASGYRTSTGAAVVAAVAGMEAIGARASTGYGQLSATASMDASGARESAGYGSLSAVAGMQAFGDAGGGGHATLSAVAGMQAAGARASAGSATLGAVASMEAVGARVSSGSGELSAVASMEAMGSRTSSGYGTLSAVAGMQAVGSANIIPGEDYAETLGVLRAVEGELGILRGRDENLEVLRTIAETLER